MFNFEDNSSSKFLKSSAQKTAIIVGAGPAGLTLAYELLKKTDVKPIIFEATDKIGGISQTAIHAGNRMDIGGHRFFSKSDEVMAWWNQILPVERTELSQSFLEKYPNSISGKEIDPEKTDEVMLVRNRMSRIYYGRKFYDYPVSFSMKTIKNLGFVRMMKIGFSYLFAKIHSEDETNLEGFYVNRFGRELYNTFFRDYTEKLWGISPSLISSDWGAQRVKGLSVRKVLVAAFKKAFKGSQPTDIAQKDVETSLIESFLYPKLGPGLLWETVARQIEEMGGEIHMQTKVDGLIEKTDSSEKLPEIKGVRLESGVEIFGDYFVSTMPVNELIAGLEKCGSEVPDNVKEVAAYLPFRDFITVGILADELKVKNETSVETLNNMILDNWIYIQEPDVRVCRLQVFNNWSPYLVQDQSKTWVGMEYVVSEHDDLWKFSDDEMIKFGISELEKIGIIDPEKVVDSTVIKIKKTYPAYFGTYPRFKEVKKFIDQYNNLFLIGRNGQHRYNNMDHSMLTAFRAAEEIQKHASSGEPSKQGSSKQGPSKIDKTQIWQVNTETEYHEEK